MRIFGEDEPVVVADKMLPFLQLVDLVDLLFDVASGFFFDDTLEVLQQAAIVFEHSRVPARKVHCVCLERLGEWKLTFN